MVQKLNNMVYPDNSIKNAQREKRGSETGHEFRYINGENSYPMLRIGRSWSNSSQKSGKMTDADA